jgi:hypothetical protein
VVYTHLCRKCLSILYYHHRPLSTRSHRYAYFYCGFYLELKGEYDRAAPLLEAAAAQPSTDYMGKMMVYHWYTFRRRWKQHALGQKYYRPLPNSEGIFTGRRFSAVV